MKAHETTSVERSERRMPNMIRQLDVDLLELAYADLGTVYAGARQTCLHCANVSECSAWLQSSNVERPAFCPNLNIFERFAARRRVGTQPGVSSTAAIDAQTVSASWPGNPILKVDASGRWVIVVAAALWSSALIALALGSVALS